MFNEAIRNITKAHSTHSNSFQPQLQESTVIKLHRITEITHETQYIGSHAFPTVSTAKT